MDIFEGVDFTPLTSMGWAYFKMAFIFLIGPCVIGGIIGKMLKLKKRSIDFLIGICGFIGLYILFSNIDEIYNWLV